MSYEVSKASNLLIASIIEIADDVACKINETFLSKGLDAKIGTVMTKQIVKNAESIADEMLETGGAGSLFKGDVQSIIDQAMFDSFSDITGDMSQEDLAVTLKIIEKDLKSGGNELMTTSSNLPSTVKQEDYNNLKNALMVNENLRTLSRSMSKENEVTLDFKIMDETVYDPELDPNDTPILATLRFEFETLGEGGLKAYGDFDYCIRRPNYDIVGG